MTEPKLSFGEWYYRLLNLAKTRNLAWLISEDPEDHRQAYLDDLTPAEELNEQIAAGD